jgi:sec-independent protein translocase protein TatA
VNVPGGWELVLVLLVVVVVFGSKRLPDSARSLGRSLRIFKAETKGLRDDKDAVVDPGALPPSTPAPAREQDRLPEQADKPQP